MGLVELMWLGFSRLVQIWTPPAIGLILLLTIITRLKNDSSWIKRTIDDIIN